MTCARRCSRARAWDEFCDALEGGRGSSCTTRARPSDPLDRAEGYRFLMRLVRYGFEGFLEYNDPLHPQLHRGSHETIKIIHENPDNLYLGARVDGRHALPHLGQARHGALDELQRARGRVRRRAAAAPPRRSTRASSCSAPDRTLRAVPRRRARRARELDAAAARRRLADRAPDLRRPRERAPSELAIERLDADERPAPLAPEQVGAGARHHAGAAARAGRHGAVVVGRPRARRRTASAR